MPTFKVDLVKSLSASSSHYFSFTHLTLNSLGPHQVEARRKRSVSFQFKVDLAADAEAEDGEPEASCVCLIWRVQHVIVNVRLTTSKFTESFYRLLKNVLEGFKTLQGRRGDRFKISLSMAPEN